MERRHQASPSKKEENRRERRRRRHENKANKLKKKTVENKRVGSLAYGQMPGPPDIGRLSQENRLGPVCGQHRPCLLVGVA